MLATMAGVRPPMSKDDLVDLGPFMQAYVLQNPFSSGSDSPVGPQRPPAPHKAIIPPSVSHPKQSPSPPRSATPKIAPKNGSTSPAPPDERADVTPEDFLIIDDQWGKVLDTPKAHIGSNVHFSAMYNDQNLPLKYIKAKRWLLSNYKFVEKYDYMTPAADLCAEVKNTFTDMTGRVLSRIINFTFPDSRKVISKNGTFYTGLVKRPSVDDFENPKVKAAAQSVEVGGMDLASAAKAHEVPPELLACALHWAKQGPLPRTEEVKTCKMQLRSVSSDIIHDNAVGLSSDSGTDGEYDDDRKDEDWKMGSLNRKRKQPTPQRVKKLSASIRKRAKLDTSPSASPCPSSVMKLSPRRGPGRPRKYKVASASEENTQMQQNGANDESDKSEHHRAKCLGSIMVTSATEGAPIAMSNSVTINGSAVVDIMPAHMIHNMNMKEEPYDPTYGSCNAPLIEGQSDSSTTSSPAPRNIIPITIESTSSVSSADPISMVAVDTKCSITPAHAGNIIYAPSSSFANTSPSALKIQDVHSIKNEHSQQLLTIQQLENQLQNAKKDLQTKDDVNRILENDLRSARKLIAHLKSEKKTQETKFSDLAKDFFELSNHFIKVTHRFKTVMNDLHINSYN